MRYYHSLQLLAIILLLEHVNTRLVCSSNPSCNCTYLESSWYIQANCSSLNLTDSPIFYHNVTTVILSQNKLKNAPNGSYLPETILHLNLSHNEITNFSNTPFAGLKDLLSLDISSNYIPLTSEVFYEDVFIDLKNLKHLDIRYNAHDYVTTENYPEVFSKLTALESLGIDILQNQSFGKQFSNLSYIWKLEIGDCTLERINQQFFENLLALKNVTFIACSLRGHFSLRSVEAGTFANLRSLEYLDISENRLLGFCALRNITNDLPHTAIRVLKARYLHCPFGQSTVLLIDDIKTLNQTKIQELYLDGNKLEMTETWAPTFLPTSLRVLGISDNRWTLQPYAFKGFANLTGISTVDLKYQDKFPSKDLGDFWFCEDFYSINECVSNRIRNDTQRWFDKDGTNCNKSATAITDVRTCVYNESTCYGFYSLIIPPNTKTIYFDKSELGDAIQPQYLSDDSLTNLSLSENDLGTWIGPMCNLTKLKYLDLSKNKCSNVTDYFFIGLTGLRTLKLNENELGLVLSSINGFQLFKTQQELQFLNLSSNKIRKLWHTSFKGLNQLEYLDLSNNLLDQWDVSISQMYNLSHIDLSRNQIIYLSEKSMKYLDDHQMNIYIDLSNNRFKCTCDSLEFLKWLRNGMGISFVNGKNYTCQTDHMDILLVADAISMLSWKCSTNYGLITGMVLLSVFIVVISAIVIYRYRWKIMYYRYVVISKGPQSGYNMLRSLKFDAFISYSDEDGYFVYRELINRLEKGEDRKLKLCINKRDFIPGTAIADNITNAIHNSSRTICVISKSFLRSNWCRYEFNIALTEGVESRQNENIVILLFLEDVHKIKLPLNMLAIRETNNCFDMFDDTHIDERWALLKQSIPHRQPEDYID